MTRIMMKRGLCSQVLSGYRDLLALQNDYSTTYFLGLRGESFAQYHSKILKNQRDGIDDFVYVSDVSEKLVLSLALFDLSGEICKFIFVCEQYALNWQLLFVPSNKLNTDENEVVLCSSEILNCSDKDIINFDNLLYLIDPALDLIELLPIFDKLFNENGSICRDNFRIFSNKLRLDSNNCHAVRSLLNIQDTFNISVTDYILASLTALRELGFLFEPCFFRPCDSGDFAYMFWIGVKNNFKIAFFHPSKITSDTYFYDLDITKMPCLLEITTVARKLADDGFLCIIPVCSVKNFSPQKGLSRLASSISFFKKHKKEEAKIEWSLFIFYLNGLTYYNLLGGNKNAGNLNVFSRGVGCISGFKTVIGVSSKDNNVLCDPHSKTNDSQCSSALYSLYVIKKIPDRLSPPPNYELNYSYFPHVNFRDVSLFMLYRSLKNKDENEFIGLRQTLAIESIIDDEHEKKFSTSEIFEVRSIRSTIFNITNMELLNERIKIGFNKCDEGWDCSITL